MKRNLEEIDCTVINTIEGLATLAEQKGLTLAALAEQKGLRLIGLPIAIEYTTTTKIIFRDNKKSTLNIMRRSAQAFAGIGYNLFFHNILKVCDNKTTRASHYIARILLYRATPIEKSCNL